MLACVEEREQRTYRSVVVRPSLGVGASPLAPKTRTPPLPGRAYHAVPCTRVLLPERAPRAACAAPALRRGRCFRQREPAPRAQTPATRRPLPSRLRRLPVAAAMAMGEGPCGRTRTSPSPRAMARHALCWHATARPRCKSADPLPPVPACAQHVKFNRAAVSGVILQKLANKLEGVEYNPQTAAAVRALPRCPNAGGFARTQRAALRRARSP